MRKVSILGVLLGGVVSLFTTTLLSIALGAYAATKVNLLHKSSQAESVAALTGFVYSDPLAYYGGMLVTFCSCILGGYVAAVTAREWLGLNGTLAALLPVLFTIYSATTHADPHGWPVLALYAVTPVAGSAIGGVLRARQVRRMARARGAAMPA